MRFSSTAHTIAAALLVAASVVAPARAQEQRLVEEVVAHVNADVITRSQYLDALRDTENDFKSHIQSPSDAQAQYEEFKPKVLDVMIDNLLLVQKAQELGIDVEPQVNERLLKLAEQQRISLAELENQMRQSGIDPNDARARLRESLLREAVLNQEVYGSIWRGLTDKEKHDFYDAHKDKFMEPGELKLSELYLPVEGHTFGEIEAKAKEIAAESRSGKPFADLVKKYGDPQRASYANAGSLGSIASASDLKEEIAKAVAPLKTGDVTDPMRQAEGVLIIHVDERREPTPKRFEDVSNDVALAIVSERAHDAEEKYLLKLREEAYIKITPGYTSSAAASESAKTK